MSANNQLNSSIDTRAFTKVAQRAILIVLTLAFSQLSLSAGWKEIRTSPTGKSGWQYVVCQGGSGWNTCELDLNIKLLATPDQLVAIGEQSIIKATVTDAYDSPVEAGVRIGWTTTDGTISESETKTDDKGETTIVLTSSHKLGGATVTATALDYGGIGSLFVPFIDKFVAYPSAYTGWANYGGYYSCTGWSPDTSEVDAGTWFVQNAWCWQTQEQWRQDRLQSVVTGNVINNGPAVPLYQAISIAISQMNVGTKVVAPACTFSKSTDHFFSIRPTDGLNHATFQLYVGYWVNAAITYYGGIAGQGVVYNGFYYTVGAIRIKGTPTGAESGVIVDFYEYCKRPL
jgi:hypothetical protein